MQFHIFLIFFKTIIIEIKSIKQDVFANSTNNKNKYTICEKRLESNK